MDIDIQTILQQDIDLGIKKNLQYEYDFAASTGSQGAYGQASSTGAASNEFGILNRYFSDNVPAAKPDEFFFKPHYLETEYQKVSERVTWA